MNHHLFISVLLTVSVCQIAPGQAINPLILRADTAYERRQFSESARLYESAIMSGTKTPFIYYSASCSFARAGNKDKALKYLELAVDGGWRNVARMTQDSDFVSIRGDRRWSSILRKAQTSKEKFDHREALIERLTTLSVQAFQYRTSARSLGGGEGSYVGYTIPPPLVSIPEATFSANVLAPNSLELIATSSLGRGTISTKVDAKGKPSAWVFTGEFKKMAEK